MATEGKETKVGYKSEKPYPETEKSTRKTHPRYSRKALIVGINEYADPSNNLSGCVNDAVDVYDTLLICGFPRTRRKLLLNEKATTENIKKELNKLVAGAEPGDVLVFYYSGHGSQVPDMDSEETDQLDEIICPHDIDFYEGKYIDDDYLKEVFSKLPAGVRCDVIFDSCFSGTATRLLSRVGLGERVESLSGKRQRYLAPPRDMLGRINSSIPSRTRINSVGTSMIGIGIPKVELKGKEQMNALWSACQEYQVAWELDIGGQVRGAFTYSLMRIFRRSNGNISRENAFSILRTTMSNEGYDQIPNLEVPSTESLQQYTFRRPHEDEPSEIPAEPGQ